MYKNNRMQYIIKTCASDDAQELQNMLNEMSMNGWELYSMSEVETEDGYKYNCIFMSEKASIDDNSLGDSINITSFKSQMEKMLSPEFTPYENCIDIQSKIANQQQKISKIKAELECEAPASINRKRLNDRISAGLKELDDLKHRLSKATSPDVMFSRLKEDKLSINLSEELLDYVDSEKDFSEDDLIASTVKARLKLTDELGYVMPKVVFNDDELLSPYEFTIKIRGLEVHKSCVYPAYSMFFADDLHLEKKPKDAIYDVDAITGKKIIWLEKTQTRDFWEKGISGSEYITRLLEFYSVKYVDELFDYSELDRYIGIVEQENPFLVENIMPDYITASDLKFLLTSLIKEKISIRNITYIFEKLNDFADSCSKSELLMKLRLSISKQICSKLANADGIIPVFDVSDKTLEEFIPSYSEEDNYVVTVDGEYAEKLAKKIIRKAKQLDIDNPIILVPMEFQHLFYTMLSNYINSITVITNEEVGCNFSLEILAEI